MAVFKCKMCGGSLEFEPGATVGVCDSCGTQQTLPNSADDAVNSLFNRANTLRLKAEFDRAEELYNKIISLDDTQAEAYWGVILCKYGVEYVEDPKTFRRVPTCHRASFDAVTADEDYKLAVKHADAAQRAIYEAEAKALDGIQKGILRIAGSEKPFDVFLCYKETDDSGARTPDSVIANDIYHQLTQEGFKVFYAAVTLEDKLGQEYEPYIFAALNSAKVMLVLGTRPEYFTAVWVKNEWSRFLKLMKADRSRLLIPCYKDMDAYELPDDFAHLQAQDMSKIGFINDVVRGIQKVVDGVQPKSATAAIPAAGGNTASLLKRAFMFLEDENWKEANTYCERVLDQEPENAQAYLGKLMAELQIKKCEELKNVDEPFDRNNNCQKASRFDARIAKELAEANALIRVKQKSAQNDQIYKRALMTKAFGTEQSFQKAAELFESISGHKDADELAKKCRILVAGTANEKKKALEELDEESRLIAEKIKKVESLGSDSSELRGRLDYLQKQIDNCVTEKNGLGLFKRKEKEELQKRIDALQQEAVAVQAEQEAQKDKAYREVICLQEELALIKKKKSQINLQFRWGSGSPFDVINKFTTKRNGFISAGAAHTVGLRADGTVIATGLNKYGQCNVSNWKDIVAVSAGGSFTVGLKADGTVVATEYTGYAYSGFCDVKGWKDIVAISAGESHTVGLRANGTVCAVGNNEKKQCNVNSWTDIVAIAAGSFFTLGLRSDGTVVMTGYVYNGLRGSKDWTNIVSISAGSNHLLGVRADGTVVTEGYEGEYGECNVNDWNDIVAVSAGMGHSVGLHADGSVIATGKNNSGQCYVSDWTDVVAISTGNAHTIGLRTDGTVIATGFNYSGQCNVDSWKSMKLPIVSN